MTHIFISYSHKDGEYVRRLSDALEKEGLSVWLDERIDYGAKWPRVIEEHVDGCGAFILVMSEHSKQSDWVQKELARALSKKKAIFPLLLDGDQWLEVQTLQPANVEGGSLPPPRFFERLAGVLRSPSIREKILEKPVARIGSHEITARFRFGGYDELVESLRNIEFRGKKQSVDPPPRPPETRIELQLDGQSLGFGNMIKGFDLLAYTTRGTHEFTMQYTPFLMPRPKEEYLVPSESKIATRWGQHALKFSPINLSPLKLPDPLYTVPPNAPIDIQLPPGPDCIVAMRYDFTKGVFKIWSIESNPEA